MTSRPTRALARAVVLALAVTAVAAATTSTLAAPSVVPAAVTTYTVNTTADTADADVGTAKCADSHGHCSLRAAVMQANFHAGPDIVRIPAGTFKLTRKGDEDGAILGDLDVTDDLTIVGAGSAKTIIDGNGAVTGDRVMQVLSSVHNFTMTGVDLRNGRRTGTFDEGGGFLWDGGNGHLAMTDVVVEGGTSRYGAGIALRYGSIGDTVDLNRVVVRNNTATAAGGGIEAVLTPFAVSFRLRSSSVYGNKAYEGGGVAVGGTLPSSAIVADIASTDIRGNHAALDAGVEIEPISPDMPFTIHNSSIHANVAGFQGGGIGNMGGYLVVTASTVFGNTAQRGAGLYAYAGSTTGLVNVTVSGNVASASGGGVYEELALGHASNVVFNNVTLGGNAATTAGGGIFRDPGTTSDLVNTIIARGSAGADCSEALGGTGNLADDASCGFGTGDSVALHLGPLKANGGPTLTQLPLAGSAAVDEGTNSSAPTTDQRGIVRPQGAALDAGAVEVCQAKPAAPALRKPTNGAALNVVRASLDWTDVACIQGYSVVVRRGSSTGTIVQSVTGLRASALLTRTLAHGFVYYWRVTAVGDRGSTVSTWRHFRVR